MRSGRRAHAAHQQADGLSPLSKWRLSVLPVVSHAAIAFAAAFVAGSINSVAGGARDHLPSTDLARAPFRHRQRNQHRGDLSGLARWHVGLSAGTAHSGPRMLALAVPSLIGGLAGAWLRKTPPTLFDRLAPFLILFATVLFMVQEPIQRNLNTAKWRGTSPRHGWPARWRSNIPVALYGGYFGAGIGILMLAALSMFGLTDIHQMNGLKNFFAVCINGVAATLLHLGKMVYWPDVMIMAVGAVLGGYLCADLARRLGRRAVWRIVIGIGFGMAISLFLKKW